MDAGTQMEPKIRRMYERLTGNRVIEVGLAVPKWDLSIGASPDGLVDSDIRGESFRTGMTPSMRDEFPMRQLVDERGMIDPGTGVQLCAGMIEIKYVRRITDEMRRACDGPSKGYSHINPDYYAQMLGGMAIFNRSWCDYIVYCHTTKELYLERIPFDVDQWNILYAQLKKFQTEIVPDVIEISRSIK